MFNNFYGRGKRSTCKSILGIVFGTAVGVTIGILFAPKAGRETREHITGKAESMRDGINYKTYDLKERVVEKAERVQEEILFKADELKEKVREKVNTIKAYKDDIQNEDYFEDVTLDSADDINDNEPVVDDISNISNFDEAKSMEINDDPKSTEEDIILEQEENIKKPKRSRKKVKKDEVEDINPNQEL